jgi:hypothetical protein
VIDPHTWLAGVLAVALGAYLIAHYDIVWVAITRKEDT